MALLVPLPSKVNTVDMLQQQIGMCTHLLNTLK